MVGIIIVSIICLTIVLCFFISNCDIEQVINQTQKNKVRLKEIELEIIKEKRKW